MPDVEVMAPSAGAAIETSAEPSPSSETVETPVEGFEPGQPDTGAEVQAETGTTVETETEAGPDGRTIPQKFRELFKANPELRNVYFSERAFREVYPTVQSAREAREFIETIGGEEGWNEVQEGRQEQATLNDLYYSRNPQKLREYAKQVIGMDAGAFKALVPVALDELHSVDPQAYSKALAPIFANTLARAFNGAGISGAITQARSLLKTNPEQADSVLQQIEQWENQFRDLASSKAETDPEREQFEQERQEWQEQRQREESDRFKSGYRESCVKSIVPSVDRHMTQLLAGRKLDTDSMNVLKENVFRKVSQMSMKDENYVKQRDQALARKDSKAALRIFTTKFNQVLPEAARIIYKTFNLGAVKPAAKQGEQKPGTTRQATSQNGVLRIAKAPGPYEIDRMKTSDRMISNGEAFLKDGKHVRWE